MLSWRTGPPRRTGTGWPQPPGACRRRICCTKSNRVLGSKMNDPGFHAAPRRAVLLAGALGATPVAAAQPARTPLAVGTARANAGVVGVVSGGVDGTYIRIAADLAAVLDD